MSYVVFSFQAASQDKFCLAIGQGITGKVLRVIWRLKNMLEIDDYTIKRQIIYS